jgi:gustatory receptor
MTGTEVFTVQIWLPFDHSSGFKFLATSLSVLWSAITFSSGLFLGDWLIYVAITLISMELEVIGCKFKEILSKSDVKLSDLKNVIEAQEKLSEVCSELELIVSKILLHNCLQGTIIICLLCFQLVILEDVTQLAVYGLVLSLVFSQIFLMCYHGQMLIDSSSGIAVQIYDSDWHSIKDERVKKIIPLLIEVNQQEKFLTAGGFNKISVELFTSVRLNNFFWRH